MPLTPNEVDGPVGQKAGILADIPCRELSGSTLFLATNLV